MHPQNDDPAGGDGCGMHVGDLCGPFFGLAFVAGRLCILDDFAGVLFHTGRMGPGDLLNGEGIDHGQPLYAL